MANPIGTYSFLSYLRLGLANKVTQPDQDPVKLRASFDVHLSLADVAVLVVALLAAGITWTELGGPG